MVPGVHDEPVGHEQEVELATLGMPGDLLDDRQIVVAGRRAIVAPSGGVIAGAEHEHAEVHLTPLGRHGLTPVQVGTWSSREISPPAPSLQRSPGGVALVDGLERRARGDAVADHSEVSDLTPELAIKLIIRHAARRGHNAVHAFESIGSAGRHILEHERRALYGANGPERYHADLLLPEPMADREHAVDRDP